MPGIFSTINRNDILFLDDRHCATFIEQLGEHLIDEQNPSLPFETKDPNPPKS